MHDPVPFFVDYVRQYTDLPFLVKLEDRDGVLVAGKNLTAADLGQDVENAAFKPVLLDGATDTVAVPKGSLGFRYGDDGVGKWNLDLGDLVPALTVAGPDGQTALVHLPRFDTLDGHGETLARGVPVRQVGEHRVCTVFDLMLAQYGVARPGLPAGPGPPGMTTPPSRTPRPGRSRSPGCPPRRPSASPGSSPATPWSPVAVR